MKDFEGRESKINDKLDIDTSIIISKFIEQSAIDTRIAKPHLCLFLALIHVGTTNLYQNPIIITRSQILHLAKINAKTTYHKCMKDLREGGYIEYYPSFHPYGASKIILCFAAKSCLSEK
jgi:hypothetical protein